MAYYKNKRAALGVSPLISLNDSSTTDEYKLFHCDKKKKCANFDKDKDFCNQQKHLNLSDSAVSENSSLVGLCETILTNSDKLTVPSSTNAASPHKTKQNMVYSPILQLYSPSFITHSLSPNVLSQWLSDPSHLKSLLVIDCRVFTSYNTSHIQSALNVHCPSILKRRIKGSDLPLEYVVPCMTQRNRLNAGEIKQVVVYDERCVLSSTVNNESTNLTMPMDSTLMHVLKSLVQYIPFHALYYIEGGFSNFAENCPHQIVTPVSPKFSALSLTTGLCHPLLHERTHSDSCLHVHGASRHARNDPVEILPWLYLGDVNHATCKSLLLHKFTALLNVSCIAIDEKLPHITYKQIKVADDADADLKTWFPEAVAFIDNVKNSHGKVLVHCRAGISRSATICIAYLMYHKRFTLEQGHEYVKARRNIIDPNFNFMQQLQEYESLLAERRTSPKSPSMVAGDLKSLSGSLHSSNSSLTAANSIFLPSPLTPVSSCQSQVFVFDSPLTSGLCHSPLLSPS